MVTPRTPGLPCPLESLHEGEEKGGGEGQFSSFSWGERGGKYRKLLRTVSRWRGLRYRKKKGNHYCLREPPRSLKKAESSGREASTGTCPSFLHLREEERAASP